MTITSFTIAISDAALSDLQQRLSATRWLDAMPKQMDQCQMKYEE